LILVSRRLLAVSSDANSVRLRPKISGGGALVMMIKWLTMRYTQRAWPSRYACARAFHFLLNGVSRQLSHRHLCAFFRQMCKTPTVYPRSLDPSQGGSGRRDLSRSKVPPEHDQLEAAPTIYRPDSRTGPEGKNYVEPHQAVRHHTQGEHCGDLPRGFTRSQREGVRDFARLEKCRERDLREPNGRRI
jgi:hypothetical protein